MKKSEAARITVEELRAREHGMALEVDFADYLIQAQAEGKALALCSAFCEVEPDGVCPHGHPSVVRALDLI